MQALTPLHGSKDFPGIALWLLHSHLTPTADTVGPSKENNALQDDLMWIAGCLSAGCCLNPLSEEAGLRLCKSLVLLSPRGSVKRGQSCKVLVIILLHILHPIFASIFGLVSTSTVSSPKAQAVYKHADSNGAASMQQPKIVQKLLLEITKDLEGEVPLGDSSASLEEKASWESYASHGEWKFSPLWLFLLGNTLLRAIKLAGLPPFGNLETNWPSDRFGRTL